jgi:hypothetical protein
VLTVLEYVEQPLDLYPVVAVQISSDELGGQRQQFLVLAVAVKEEDTVQQERLLLLVKFNFCSLSKHIFFQDEVYNRVKQGS